MRWVRIALLGLLLSTGCVDVEQVLIVTPVDGGLAHETTVLIELIGPLDPATLELRLNGAVVPEGQLAIADGDPVRVTGTLEPGLFVVGANVLEVRVTDGMGNVLLRTASFEYAEADGEGAEGGVFDALTYNVAGLPEPISGSSPQAYSPLISPRLNAYDLVLVQEDFFYHDVLSAGAAHPFRTLPLDGYITFAGDGLNRFMRQRLTAFVRTRWSKSHGVTGDGNDSLSSKGFSFGRHELSPGVTLDVYNIHADAGGAPGDLRARVAQYEQLAAAIATRSGGRALIVAGDTNLTGYEPGDEEVLQQFLATVGLTDVARQLGGSEQLDRFLYRSGPALRLRPLSWRLADEFVTADGTPLSDHEAIHVRFRWRVGGQ